MTPWDWIAWALVAVWLWQLWPIWLGIVSRRRLSDVAPASHDDPDLPMISIIVPARDEAAAVGECLRRLRRLDYPSFEVIAINDRSTDATGRIMDASADGDGRIRVVHVTDLPAGWLGKNHANQRGAEAARGDLLLFTDGDVLFEPHVLRHAAAAMRRDRLDLLVLFPDTMTQTFREAVVMNYFGFLFLIATKPSLARHRWAKRAAVGIGAFNLIRRPAYETIGTHKTLRLEIGDDVMLGRLVKARGLKLDALLGDDLVRVKWQTGIRGMIRGLEKNAFAGLRLNTALAGLAVAAQVVLNTLPFIMMWTGPFRAQCATYVVATLATATGIAVAGGLPVAAALLHPAAGLIFAYIIARSMWITLRDGGVTWRETFYPLADLRAGRVRPWRTDA